MVVWTLYQGFFSRGQGLLPLLGERPLPRICVSVYKTAKDQLDQGWMQLVEVWGAFGRADP